MHNATHFNRNLDKADDPAQTPVEILPHLSQDDVLGSNGVWETVDRLKSDGLIRYPSPMPHRHTG